VRGCYRCLLSYGNQLVHELVDRRLVVGRLRALAGAVCCPDEVTPAMASGDTGRTVERTAERDGGLGELLRLLRELGLRLPDRVEAEIDGVPVDLVYDSVPMRSVVLIDDDHGARRDAIPLIFGGWNVIHIGAGEDLATVVGAHPGVFGRPRDDPNQPMTQATR
jgi:hypothetical protein